MLIQKSGRQTGVSLIELMIGIVISLLVLLGLTSVYLNSSRSSRTTMAANQLNQDMRAVMDIMVNDIRRAGYWGSAASGTNPFTTAATDINISNSGSCVLYSYDAVYSGSAAGTVQTSDFFGFQLSAGVLQTLNSTTISASTTPCGDTAWENLTDERAINVSALSFDTVGSKCISFAPTTYDPTDPSKFTTWTTTGGSEPACSATVANGAPATALPATNTRVETRQIRITLTANSRSEPTLSRSLSDTVLVRNNRVIAP